MKQILLPDSSDRPLVFYLAMEEYVASDIGEGFFTWNVAPTVIFGRNQDMEAEVNLRYCRENAIRVFRRKSGGGCVYADRGNLMVSYIVPKGNVDEVFSAYLDRMCESLRGLGLDAVKSSHNDILLSGRKISGNAFFSAKDASIVHGTLIYDVDLEAMVAAITPPAAKLERHGVQSVRQRVTCIKPFIDCSMEGLRNHLASCFTDGTRMLSADELEAIETIEKEYLDESFIKGQKHL